ncbi:hypothetical protein OS493_011534 [Desmophyllum pertusum]|uniref:Uncharacterized protein n=1 Tax=Desmophyllum pertusum TaxID=174260 RepID=A0A9W9YQR6_9CNID|nr:hypothetical protein OS493_011534 [Desmophyllum pertusum]
MRMPTELGDAFLEKLDIVVGMTVAEVDVTVVKLGVTVAEDFSISSVLLIAMVELLNINEELETRGLGLVEAVLFAPITVVVFCTISLDLIIPSLALNTVVMVCDVKRDVTKLENELNTGVVLEIPTSVVDTITVLFPVNIAVVSSVVDFRVLILSVKRREVDEGANLLEFNTLALLSIDVTTLENASLVCEAVTNKLLEFGSKMVEETTVDVLLGRIVAINEELLVNSLLALGTTDEEFTTNIVDETSRVEIRICVVLEGKLLFD